MSKQENPALTEEQKQFILDNFDKISLIELTRRVADDPSIDGRSSWGRVVRTFLADNEKEYKTTKFEKAEEVILTEEQKLFCRNNYKTMTKPLEAARILFKDPQMTALYLEAKAVYKYYESIDPTSIPKEDRIVEDVEYKPPISISRIVPRINKYYIKNVGTNSQFLDRDNLRPEEKKCCQALLDSMNVEKFIQQCSKYYKAADRELFESTFVRFCYDKPDLLPEEVDTYISACAETVTISKIDRLIESMENQLETMLDGSSDDGKKLSVTFVEAIKNQRDQLDKSKKHYKSLMENLTGSRAKRLENKQSDAATVLNLVEAVKSEEHRIALIKIAEKQKLLEADEVDILSNMDSVTALIAGLSKKRAKYG